MSRFSRAQIAAGYVARAQATDQATASRELAALLLSLRRELEIEEIVTAIGSHYHEAHGYVEAQLTTAFALSSQIKSQLRQLVKQRLKAQTVHFNELVDKDLLGGVVVSAANFELDLSLKTRLAGLSGVSR